LILCNDILVISTTSTRWSSGSLICVFPLIGLRILRNPKIDSAFEQDAPHRFGIIPQDKNLAPLTESNAIGIIVLIAETADELKHWIEIIEDTVDEEEHNLRPCNPVDLDKRLRKEKTSQEGVAETIVISDEIKKKEIEEWKLHKEARSKNKRSSRESSNDEQSNGDGKRVVLANETSTSDVTATTTTTTATATTTTVTATATTTTTNATTVTMDKTINANVNATVNTNNAGVTNSSALPQRSAPPPIIRRASRNTTTTNVPPIKKPPPQRSLSTLSVNNGKPTIIIPTGPAPTNINSNNKINHNSCHSLSEMALTSQSLPNQNKNRLLLSAITTFDKGNLKKSDEMEEKENETNSKLPPRNQTMGDLLHSTLANYRQFVMDEDDEQQNSDNEWDD